MRPPLLRDRDRGMGGLLATRRIVVRRALARRVDTRGVKARLVEEAANLLHIPTRPFACFRGGGVAIDEKTHRHRTNKEADHGRSRQSAPMPPGPPPGTRQR